LATDPLFARRVSQNSISRLLNTIAWTLHDAALERVQASHSLATTTPLPPSPSLEPINDRHDDDFASSMLAEPPSPRLNPQNGETGSVALPTGTAPATYLQGMNVLAAPFLYASRSEPQAYTLLHTLLTIHLPSYITPSMTGVHRGLSLLERLLEILDPTLSQHFASKHLYPTTYAFASILTLSACTPPLPEVLVLWDFYFAWGVHLNILGVIAQLYLMRDKLLASDSPVRDLRSLGPLRARNVIELVVSFVPRVGDNLWKELVNHTNL
jgi:cell cycle arrest protein BUB2